ncbi:MAG: hypothetical protein OSB19_08715, partial [Opitutaceae bacterium]|nr:hypothetical protein [Opitutaceae bacterium]
SVNDNNYGRSEIGRYHLAKPLRLSILKDHIHVSIYINSPSIRHGHFACGFRKKPETSIQWT